MDILINNAGHSSKARNVRWVGQEEWDAVINVNLTGVYALIQAALPGMIERGGGTIVTVGSVAALKPGLIGGAPYGAAKAGVLNLMGHVHTVLRDKGIRATTVMPAEVDTPILNNRPLPPDAAARATMAQPEDVAAAIMLCVTSAGAHRDRGARGEPDPHARPEPGHRSRAQPGRAAGGEVALAPEGRGREETTAVVAVPELQVLDARSCGCLPAPLRSSS